MKKVLIVCENLSSKGGIERTSELICNNLQDRFDVQIISLASGDEVDTSADVVIFQGFSPKILEVVRRFKSVSSAKIVVAHHGAPEVWHYFLDGERIEKLGFSYVGAKRLFKRIFWNIGYRRRGETKIVNLYRKMYEYSDRIVLLSDTFKDKYCEIGKFIDFEFKLTSIPNSLRFKAVEIVDEYTNRKNLLFVGRLVGIKRVDRVLGVWRRIAERFPDWSLRIVGDGTLEADLRRQASDLDRVIFVNHCENVSSEYQKSSILLFTSDLEGFGMVLTEAMQFGVVPVAYNSFSALGDIVNDGKNGFAVTPFDEDEFADKVVQLIENKEILKRMGDCARVSVEKFSTEKIMPLWIKLIDELTD